MMLQPALFQPPALSVSELSQYLRQLLESDEILQDTWVRGEISNLSRPVSGHVYFTLKDPTAALRCVIWKSSALRIRTPLQNGSAIEAHGAISIYERDGAYQLYIDMVRPAGEGRLYQEFLRLKAKLEAEGLFDQDRKRPISVKPHRLGIVTSSTGAALQDMLNTLGQRYPLVELFLAPCAVQGEKAPEEIVSSIELLNRLAHPNTILVARGGGSLEDLWAFNDERVVRAIASSITPVITGIGHETDFTLSDFAADLRAPTPTGAAVLATPDISEFFSLLADYGNRLDALINSRLQRYTVEVDDLESQLRRASPLWEIQNNQQQVDNFSSRLNTVIIHAHRLRTSHFSGVSNHLKSLNPLSILARGYSVVSDASGKIIQNISQVEIGDLYSIRLVDGSFSTRVENKSE
jgi:exodeoxyribonuclease VII large subunit